MYATLAGSIGGHVEAASRRAAGSPGRDLRLDFVRGLALLMIFIDHVSGNRFTAITLQSMGFADAAEVFVFIAGMAAVFAYRKAFEQSWRTGVRAVAGRMRTLYLVHLAMAAGLIALAGVAMMSASSFDIIAKLGLPPLVDNPVQALLRLPALAFLPHYMDIIPLYIALFAALPLLFPAMRLHILLPVAVAGVAYVAVRTTGINLPSLGQENGWFLNPFAWLVVFALGMTTAELSRTGQFGRLPRALVLAVTATSLGYVAFSFLHAAPWRAFPALADMAAFDWRLSPDKQTLSWHRLADIAAKAWLVAVFVPRAATFMSTGMGGAITRAGRNSLPVFVAGVYLSMLGSILMFEADGQPLAQIGVTLGGVAALLTLAWALERWSGSAAAITGSAMPGRAPAGTAPASARS
jgi:hypothetical protein